MDVCIQICNQDSLMDHEEITEVTASPNNALAAHPVMMARQNNFGKVIPAKQRRKNGKNATNKQKGDILKYFTKRERDVQSITSAAQELEAQIPVFSDQHDQKPFIDL